MKRLLIAILIAGAGIAHAQRGGTLIWSRPCFRAVPLGTAASNSTVIATMNQPHLGNYAVELQIRGTGTVNYVKAQISNDNVLWYDYGGSLIASGTTYSVISTNAPSGVYTNIDLPPARYFRLTAKAAANQPIISGWFIVH